MQSLFPATVQVEYAQHVSEITPGNMFKHYSPKGKVQLFKDINQILFPLSSTKTAILVTQEWIDDHKDRVDQFVAQGGVLYLR